jgi:hypothetical protein
MAVVEENAAGFLTMKEPVSTSVPSHARDLDLFRFAFRLVTARFTRCPEVQVVDGGILRALNQASRNVAL